ncbi:MAG: DUF3400 domain-containing protein, partial [Zoogloeaceae bacterium]|nr:DUF3400 domain-containing protein [Zoogloeaceae bacterium]
EYVTKANTGGIERVLL